jgi:hypothetical protein
MKKVLINFLKEKREKEELVRQLATKVLKCLGKFGPWSLTRTWQHQQLAKFCRVSLHGKKKVLYTFPLAAQMRILSLYLQGSLLRIDSLLNTCIRTKKQQSREEREEYVCLLRGTVCQSMDLWSRVEWELAARPCQDYSASPAKKN